MAVAAALVSSLANKPLPENGVYFGEVSLSGHLRPVSQAAGRLKEAGKLGFERATFAGGSEEVKADGLQLRTLTNLVDLVVELASDAAIVLQESDDTGKG